MDKRFRRFAQSAAVLAVIAMAAAVSVGCSSHSIGGQTPSHTFFPYDSDARKMLLQPHDLTGDWTNGPLHRLFSRPCVPATLGLVGQASVELEDLSDPLSARGLDERVTIFDSHADAMSSLNQLNTVVRCYVDTLNSGGLDTSNARFSNGILTLQPAPEIGDGSVASEITFESRASDNEPPAHGFLQYVTFVDDLAVVGFNSHSFEFAVPSDELSGVAQAALRRERSARGVMATTTP